MSKIFHILQTSFTGRGLKQWDEDWLKLRIGIFKEFTVPSLMNQTEKNFIHWITFRPQDKGNNLIAGLMRDLAIMNHKCVISFTGQPYFYTHAGNADLKDRVKNGLNIMKEFYNDEPFVYLSVIDSDDLYHKDAIAEIQSHEYAENRALFYKLGYLLNVKTLELATYTGGMRCPPFWTILYKAEDFWDVEKYLEHTRTVVHHDIPIKYDAVLLTDFRYAMGVGHGSNTSTRWHDPAKIADITDLDERKALLKDLGVEHD